MNIQARLLTVAFYNCKAEQCCDEAAVRAAYPQAVCINPFVFAG